MPIDLETCYRALEARDPRFDGLFFVGVATTGIYCRPICPAPTAKRSSCEFFPHAAAAESAGFRPCLRCRPELAPDDASSRFSLEQALYREIQVHALTGAPMTDLVARTGYSVRQMRRIVTETFGVTPIAIAQTERLLFAKKLLQETSLPVTQIALDAGFGSVRRFKHVFKTRYRCAPLDLRRDAGGTTANDDLLRLRLAFRPPFAWDELLAYLPTRGVPGVETVVNGSYLRTFEIDGRAGWLSVRELPGRNCLEVAVAPEFAKSLATILRNLRRLFDLDANPQMIAAHLGRDPVFGATLAACPGLRIPGAWHFFELSVRAILGQQISVARATVLAGKLTDLFGTEIQTPFPALNRVFFSPERLAAATPEEIATIGLPRSRARTLHEFARATAAGKLDFPPATTAETIVAALCELPGIGPWTANYIAMRGFSLPDAFPTADLGLYKATGLKSAKELDALAENWRPWRSYAALHLWKSLRMAAEQKTL